MILTCPQCATRYFLPDVQVGRAGRTVKCTNCGTAWRAETPPESAPPPAPPPPPPVDLPDPEVEFAAAAQRRAEILREKKLEAERKAREAGMITAAVWAGVAAAIAISVAGGIVFRIQVARWWPGAATGYAKLGMPVNASGLLIDKVQAAPAVVGGRHVLMVTGVLTNVSAGLRAAPAFKVTVLDKASRPLMDRVINVAAVALKVGEMRRFQLQVTDPPPGANDVEVTLAPPATLAPTASSAPPPAAAKPAQPGRP
jgi:predicted Zn finger-like uncharacterized protein